MRHRLSVGQRERKGESNFHCNCNCNSTLKFDFDSDSEHTKAKGSLGQKVGVAAPNAIANITFLEDRADGKDFSNGNGNCNANALTPAPTSTPIRASLEL